MISFDMVLPIVLNLDSILKRKLEAESVGNHWPL